MRFRSVSSGSWTACSTARSALAARKARAPRLSAWMAAFGRRTRTGFIPCFAGGGDDGADGPRSRRDFTANSRANLASRFMTAWRRRPRRSKKKLLAKLSPQQVKLTELAGEKIQAVLTHAPGNGAAIGGLKVIGQSGWFAARPSGTEDIYKIYARELPRTRSICAAFWRKPRRSSARRWPRRRRNEGANAITFLHPNLIS